MNTSRLGAVPALFVVSAIAGTLFLSGCGGSEDDLVPVASPTPTASPTPVADPTVVRSGVAVLPTDGSVQIGAVTADSVTLSGNGIPALTPGAVLVSGQGSGLLRKVVSTTTVGGQIVVQTDAATLEDVFKSADIKIENRPFALTDFTNVSLAPGVTVVEGDATEADNRSVHRGREVSNTFTFTLPITNLAAGDGQVTAQASVAVTLSLDANIQIDDEGVKHVLFKPTVIGVVKLIGKSTYKTSFSKSFTYAELDGRPFTIQAGPIPLVFTPHFKLSLNASGNADVGLTLTSRAKVTSAASTEYTRGTGWNTTLDWAKNGSFIVGKNLYATLDSDVTPAHLELGLSLYESATGSLQADYPTINFHLAHESVPPAGLRFTETANYHGYANYNVSILGRTLTNYQSGDFIHGSDKWDDQFFPDNGNIKLGVQ